MITELLNYGLKLLKVTGLVTTSVFLISNNPINAQITIGDDLIARPDDDVFSGNIFVVPDSFGPAIQTLVSFSIFDDEDANQNITPLILEDLGGSFTIRGIGTTRTSDASGIQTFGFDLVSGSSDIGGDLFFGWHDGDISTTNDGVIDVDLNSPGDSIVFLGDGNTNFGVNDNFAVSQTFARSYSVQATAIPFNFSPALGIFMVGSIYGLSRLKKNALSRL